MRQSARGPSRSTAPATADRTSASPRPRFTSPASTTRTTGAWISVHCVTAAAAASCARTRSSTNAMSSSASKALRRNHATRSI